MSLIDDISNKMDALQNEEFSITETQAIDSIENLDDGLSAIVTSATVFFINIKNIPFIVSNDGKRAASKTYKLYQEALRLFANETNGVLVNYTNSSILIIYPTSIKEIDTHINNAFQLSYLIGRALPQKYPELSNINISVGIDHGRILGTKCVHGSLWYGSCIDKAAAISAACVKPSFIGVSRLVYSEISESLKNITIHRVLGFSKKEQAWQKSSYQLGNESKHFYSTRHNIEI